jgi:hypothetical protein
MPQAGSCHHVAGARESDQRAPQENARLNYERPVTMAVA